MLRITITLLALFAFSPAYADESTGKVTHIDLPTYSKIVLFGLDGVIAEKPRCNRDQQFTINLATPNGETLFQALLVAKANKFNLKVTGLNTCIAHSRSEDVKSILIQ